MHSLINMAALQIALRKMLHEDDSMSMMLFFGFVGALNAVCLAPVLLILHLAGSVSAAGLTLRVLSLTVCKGIIPLPAPASCLPLVICLAPVLLILHLATSVSASGLPLRVFALTVCKGAASSLMPCQLSTLKIAVPQPLLALELSALTACELGQPWFAFRAL